MNLMKKWLHLLTYASYISGMVLFSLHTSLVTVIEIVKYCTITLLVRSEQVIVFCRVGTPLLAGVTGHCK
jgi:hypothetical protein